MVRLLLTAAETTSADIYNNSVEDVLGAWRGGRLNDLTAADLADAIEKHLWLLPAAERMSGEGFLVKQEISMLRSA